MGSGAAPPPPAWGWGLARCLWVVTGCPGVPAAHWGVCVCVCELHWIHPASGTAERSL